MPHRLLQDAAHRPPARPIARDLSWFNHRLQYGEQRGLHLHGMGTCVSAEEACQRHEL